MASPKVTPKGLVSFLELRNRCPSDQIHHLNKVIEKNRQYKERIRVLNVGLPPIDWEYYKRNVRAEAVGMVERFQKQYTGFSIPKPEDKYTPQIEKLKEEVKNEVAEFVKKSNARIEAYQKEIERIRSLMAYSQMTWEDYCTLYPDRGPDFINRPTYWPHDDAEQIGYVEPRMVPIKKAESKGGDEKKKKENEKPVAKKEPPKKKDDKKKDKKK